MSTLAMPDFGARGSQPRAPSGGEIPPELAARFGRCDLAVTQLIAGDHHVQATAPWAGDRRTYLVRPAAGETGESLAARLLATAGFIEQLDDTGLPVESLTLLTPGGIGEALRQALGAQDYHPRVYEPSAELTTEPRFAIADGGHWIIHGGLTATHELAIAYELVRARDIGFEYAETPAGTGPTRLDDRAGTLRMLDAGLEYVLPDLDRVGWLDLRGPDRQFAGHERPDVLWAALLRLLRDRLGAARTIVDMTRDSPDGPWRTIDLPGAVRRQFTATGPHRLTGEVGVRAVDFNNPGRLLTADAVDRPEAAEALATWLAESALDGHAVTVHGEGSARLQAEVLHRLRTLGAGESDARAWAGAMVHGVRDPELSEQIRVGPFPELVEAAPSGAGPSGAGPFGTEPSEAAAGVGAPVGGGVLHVLDVLVPDHPALAAGRLLAAHYLRHENGEEESTSDAAQQAPVWRTVAAVTEAVALLHLRAETAMMPGRTPPVTTGQPMAVVAAAIGPEARVFLTVHEELVREVLGRTLPLPWDEPLPGRAGGTAADLLAELLHPERTPSGRRPPDPSGERSEASTLPFHLPRIDLRLAGEPPGYLAADATAMAAVATALGAEPGRPRPGAADALRTGLYQLVERYPNLAGAAGMALQGVDAGSIARWLRDALAALPPWQQDPQDSVRRVATVLGRAGILPAGTGTTTSELAAALGGEWLETGAEALRDLPDGTVTLVLTAEPAVRLRLIERTGVGLALIETQTPTRRAWIQRPDLAPVLPDSVMVLMDRDGIVALSPSRTVAALPAPRVAAPRFTAARLPTIVVTDPSGLPSPVPEPSRLLSPALKPRTVYEKHLTYTESHVWMFIPRQGVFAVLTGALGRNVERGTVLVVGEVDPHNEAAIQRGKDLLSPGSFADLRLFGSAAHDGTERPVLILDLIGDHRRALTFASWIQRIADRAVLLDHPAPRGVVLTLHKPDRWFAANLLTAGELTQANNLDEAVRHVRLQETYTMDPLRELSARADGVTATPGVSTPEVVEFAARGQRWLPDYDEPRESEGSFAEDEIQVPVRPGATPIERMDTARIWLDPDRTHVAIPRAGHGTMPVRVGLGLLGQVFALPAEAGAPARSIITLRPRKVIEGARHRIWVNPGAGGELTAVALDPWTDWSFLDRLPADVAVRLVILPLEFAGGALRDRAGALIDAAALDRQLPDPGSVLLLTEPMQMEADHRFVLEISRDRHVVSAFKTVERTRWIVYRRGALIRDVLDSDLGDAFAEETGGRFMDSLDHAVALAATGGLTAGSDAVVALRRAMATAPPYDETVAGWLPLPGAGGPVRGGLEDLLAHHPAGLAVVNEEPPAVGAARISAPGRFVRGVPLGGNVTPVVDLAALAQAGATLAQDGHITVEPEPVPVPVPVPEPEPEPAPPVYLPRSSPPAYVPRLDPPVPEPPGIGHAYVRPGLVMIALNHQAARMGDVFDFLTALGPVRGFVVWYGRTGPEPAGYGYRQMVREFGLYLLEPAVVEPAVVEPAVVERAVVERDGENPISPTGWRVTDVAGWSWTWTWTAPRAMLSAEDLVELERRPADARPPSALDAAFVTEVNRRLGARAVRTDQILAARDQLVSEVPRDSRSQLETRVTEYLRHNNQQGRLLGGAPRAMVPEGLDPLSSPASPSYPEIALPPADGPRPTSAEIATRVGRIERVRSGVLRPRQVAAADARKRAEATLGLVKERDAARIRRDLAARELSALAAGPEQPEASTRAAAAVGAAERDLAELDAKIEPGLELAAARAALDSAELAAGNADRAVEEAARVHAEWTQYAQRTDDLTEFGPRGGSSGRHSYLGYSYERFLPGDTAARVRAMVRRAAAPTDTAAHTDIERFTSADALLGDLPTATGEHGSTHLVGAGPDAVRVTLYAVLERLAQPAAVPVAPVPTVTQGEHRKFQDVSLRTAQTATNYRSLPTSDQMFLGTGPASMLRVANVTANSRLVHGQQTRTTSTEMGSVHGLIERLREPGHAHHYDVRWQVAVEPATAAVGPAGPPAGDDEVTGRVEIYFPEHIAIPDPPPGGRKPEPKSDYPMSLDTLHDPGEVGRHALRQLGEWAPDTEFDAETQRTVLDFASHGNLHANLPTLISDGLYSNPLFDEAGRSIGVLRLRAELAADETSRVVTRSSNNSLEFVNESQITEGGTFRLQNSVDGSVTAGPTVITAPESGTTTLGTYWSGGAGITAGAGFGVQHGSDVSTDSYIGRGFVSGHDHHTHLPRGATVADVGLRWTLELHTAAGLAPASTTWVGGSDGHGARVRWLDYDTDTAKGTDLHPPASILDGDGQGMAYFRNFSAAGSTDAEVVAHLISEGYLAREGAGDAHQLINLQKLKQVTSGAFRAANLGRLRGEGVWVTFEKSEIAIGVSTRIVRFVIPGAATANYQGRTDALGLLFSSDSFARMGAVRSRFRSHQESFGGTLTVPVKKFVENSAIANLTTGLSAGAGGAQWTTTATNIQAVGHQTLIEYAQDVHRFDLTLHLHAEAYGEGDSTASWRSGTDEVSVEAWLPDMRVLTAPPEPRAALEPRPVTATDELLLQHAPALSRLGGAVAVRGSRAITNALDELANRQFAHRSGRGVLFGLNPGRTAATSAQVRRVLAGEERLLSELPELFSSAVVSDNQFQPGALNDVEGRYLLQAYVAGRPKFIRSQLGGEHEAYVEDGHSRISASILTETTEKPVAGLLGKMKSDATASVAIAHTHTAAGITGRRVERDRTSDTRLLSGRDYRVNAYVATVYTVHVPITVVATLASGSGNVLARLAGVSETVTRQAVDLPDGIEAVVSATDLAEIWVALEEQRWDDPALEQIPADQRWWVKPDEAVEDPPAGLPWRTKPGDVIEDLPAEVAEAVVQARLKLPRPDAEPGVGAVFPPRRIAARRGLGQASVIDVIMPPRRLYESALARLQESVPGITRVGSSTYSPAALQQVAKRLSVSGISSALPQYFSSARPDGEAVLDRFTVHALTQAGMVAVTVRTSARPSASAPPESVFGYPQTGALYEMYGMDVDSRVRGSQESRGWNLRAVAPGYTKPSPEHRVRMAGATGTVDWQHQRTQGTARTARAETRSVAKSKSPLVRAEYPIELVVDVQVQPIGDWLVATAGPAIGRFVSSWWSKTFGTAEAATREWIPAGAVIEFDAHEGTAEPIDVTADDGSLNLLLEVQEGAPDEVHGQPVIVPPGAGAELDRIRGMAVPADLDANVRINSFSATPRLLEAVRQVLPGFDEVELAGFVNGEIGGGNLHALLTGGGVNQRFLSTAFGPQPVGDLSIRTVRATPWREITEHRDENSVLEAFRVSGTSVSEARRSERRLTPGVLPLVSVNLTEETYPTAGDVPAHGIAPDKQKYVNATLPGFSFIGSSAREAGTAQRQLDLSAQRIAPGAAPAGADPPADSPVVTRRRDVLLEITGKIGPVFERPTAAPAWLRYLPGLREGPARTVLVAGTVEARIARHDLDTGVEVHAGRYFPSAQDTPQDRQRAAAEPSFAGWTRVFGSFRNDSRGPTIGGRTAAQVQAALDLAGLPRDANLVIEAGDQDFARQLVAYRESSVLVRAEGGWQAFGGRLPRELIASPDLAAAITVLAGTAEKTPAFGARPRPSSPVPASPPLIRPPAVSVPEAVDRLTKMLAAAAGSDHAPAALMAERFRMGLRRSPIPQSEMMPAGDWMRRHLLDPGLGGVHRLRTGDELRDLMDQAREDGMVITVDEARAAEVTAVYTRVGDSIWRVAMGPGGVAVAERWNGLLALPAGSESQLAVAINKCADPR